ncbi:ABC transporter ATP-binding protein [candidate division MSBL1 archaeon SCGC-AAA259M10]|uniref:ABC transporter ATP-binding protein n=2 Tax=candidate division MSBL1 TaxID=215777 RepID=A0A133U706_9EURY|nr:ABC transporter ATP-binding protein [candidate division MSBL1 archaeon SCGC-AAA259B11]KXA99913.1 ABC transporter ATP-binding protein [candidate division MSBL1 archaeon SCGC-AAA259M10]
MNILEVRNLELWVNSNKILDDVSLDIEENRVYAIVGPNGAGKSTLAYSIMGLEGYTGYSGDILFKGESLNGLDISERAEKGITLAWQEPARFEGLTVRKFIKSAASEKSDESVRSAIEKVGMDPDQYLDRAVDKGLSGGERKKIELASILAMEPELVLLDEPDSGIDVASLDRIFEGIELLKEKGSTVILITHSATAHRQAEYAYLMCRGAILDEGPIDDIGSYFEERCIPCDHKNAPEEKEGGIEVDGSQTTVQSG